MQRLDEIYYALPTRYAQLKEVEQQADAVYYTSVDFHDIEPYFAEFHNINPGTCGFLVSEEDFQHAKRIYEYHVKDRKLIVKRERYGESTRYDTFYEYSDKEDLSYKIYTSTEKTAAINVARISYDQNGNPTVFESFSEHGAMKKTYEFDDMRGTIISTFTSYKLAEEHKETYMVFFRAGENGVAIVEKIMRLPDEVIYRRECHDTDLEILAAKVVNHLAETIHEQMESQVRIDQKAACMLLEYTLQSPFPPTVAVGLESERQQTLRRGDQPSLFFNAPDMHYFSEENTLNIDLRGDEGMYAAINRHLDLYEGGNEHDVVETMVFNLYVDVCRKLAEKSFANSLPDKTQDFVILARDFEQCNEQRFLQALMDPADYEEFSRHENQFADSDGEELSPQEQAQLDSLRENHGKVQQQYQVIASEASTATVKTLYARTDIFHLKPYFFQIESGKAAPTERAHPASEIDFEPRHPFVEYGYDADNRISYSRNFFDAYHYTTYYHYGKDRIHAYGFSEQQDETPSLIRYAILEQDATGPVKYTECEQESIEEADYKTAAGAISTSCHREKSYFHGYKLDREYTLTYEYRDKQLYQIRRAGDDEQDYVVFATDNSYILEAGKKAADVYFEQLMALLRSKNRLAGDISHLVLVYETRLFFCPQIYLMTRRDPGEANSNAAFEDKFHTAYRHGDLDLHVDPFQWEFTAFGAYTRIEYGGGGNCRLRAVQAESIIHQTCMYLCDKLQAADLSGFFSMTTDFLVFAKNELQSFDDALTLRLRHLSDQETPSG